jgi:hypothetical protein
LTEATTFQQKQPGLRIDKSTLFSLVLPLPPKTSVFGLVKSLPPIFYELTRLIPKMMASNDPFAIVIQKNHNLLQTYAGVELILKR